MDGAANWRPTQGADPAAVAAAGGVDPNAAAPTGTDWRTQLQPEARHRIVNKIMETLKKHLPVSVPEGLTELHKIAVRFEEKIYTAATNQSDYLRKISLKMLSMESQTKTQQNPGNAQVIPNQNPPGPAPGLPPQGSNPAQSSAIPLMSQQQTRQPNASTSVQGSLPSLGQNLSSVGQTSTLQNLSGMPQNTMNNGLAQGTPQDMYAAQRQMAGRQQQQQQQQQQAHNQLMYQQQKLLMNQKLQQNSLMQPHIQQQQTLLQSTQMQSSQQPMMQMSSGLQPGQTTIQQTQSMAMQSATQSGIQQNPLNSVQQSVQSLLQQPTQSVVRQQQHPQSMHQQPSLQQTQPTQQPNIPLQQQQQQLMGQQSNLQQNQLMNQQSGAVEMQQQQRLPVQSNNLLNMQQTQQMMNQQSMPLHQPQQLANQGNMSSLHQQQQQNQQQQQQLLGAAPNVRMHMLQQQKPIQQPQQQQHAQQTSMGLMQPQSQQNQLQQPQQHMMSQFQSQPNQVQQQLGMQQRLQTSAGMLLQQNNIDHQKQYVQAQRGLQEAPSTSVDSTAQTGHPGAGDLQEEIYQMIKSLKDQYFGELNDLYSKISMKIQHIDAHMPPAQKSAEQYEKMKSFKVALERTLHFLQVNKSSIQPGFREKIPIYERQILSFLSSQRRKPVQAPGQQTFQQSGGQAPSSNISQQHQTSQGLQQHDSHTNQMPQASLPSMNTGVQTSGAPGIQHVPAPQATNFGVPTPQQNVTNAPQAGSNLENAQGNNFNPVQHGSMSTALQQGSTGPMQGALNAQQQSSSNMISNNAMSTMQTNTNAMQANANSLQQLKQQHQEHQMMQSQQMKQRQQMMQQIQQKQMLQQQLPMQQLQKQQQQGQMQVPQLHSGNDMNELKVRQGAAIKSGMYQQLSQRNYYHQQIKQGGVFPISSPQNLQASSPQISHHSPQVDQHSLLQSQVKTGTPLNSANSPFVPSPSPPVAPSPMPVDSDKPLSNLSSLTNAGQAGHQQTSLAPQTQSIAVNTPGISASPLLAEFTSADGSQVNLPTQVPTKSAAERPLDRLLKALRTTQQESLSAAVSDIGSVVSMIDRIAGSAPGNGSRAAVGEDLVAMTKCRLQARNFITHDGSGASKKMKRDTSAMPLNVSSAGSVNDSLKQSYSVGTPELQSTATSRVKWQRAEVNHALMEEIQEINQQLIDTELHVSEDDAESFTTSEGGEGTVIRCTFTAVAVSPSLKSMFASAQMSPILPLRLLVPASYPKCSPVLLDKFPHEQWNSDDLSTKAKSKFSVLLRGLAEPMSLREIARTWDACARKVIAEYAQQTGGGSFSSSYGCWESCVGAS